MRDLNISGLISRIRFALALVVVLAVAACGGGGGGGSATTGCLPYQAGCTSGSGSGSGSTASPTVTLAIINSSSGAATTTLPSAGSVTVSATVRDATGAAVANTVVTFSTNASLAVFNPASGTALTNSSGVATIQMSAAALSAAGAADVTASATVSTVKASGSGSYQVGAADLTLSAFSISATSIPAYGTSTISTTVNVNGSPTTAPLTVAFSSGCALSGKATLPVSVQTVNGIATATYTDKGCNGTDTVTLSILDKTVQGTIKSAGPAPANIQFVSATPSSIALKGTAGLVDISNVTFKVVDASGNPVSSSQVEFYLTNWTGGIKLDDNTQTQVDAMTGGKVRKQTAADGTVSVTVQAGTNPTSIWVLANVLGSSLNTQSSKLVISTGLPSQDRFSLSVGTHNIEGWQYDGVTTNLTVYAFDRVGNPVPDGSTVNFVTEGAGTSPIGGTCSVANGSCSIQFVSGENRPRNELASVCADATDLTTCVTSGRVTVLAYANGEEGFDDTNGNNQRDAGETFRDIGDVFVDNNEDGVWTSPEQFFPFVAAADNLSTGAACSSAYAGYGNAKSKAGTCNGKWGQAQVRRDQVIVLSGSYIGNVYKSSANTYVESKSDVYVGDTFGFVPGNSCAADFTIRISDGNNNPLPAGTKIEVDDNSVFYFQTGGTDAVSAGITVGVPTVLDTNAPGGTYHSFQMKGSKCATIPSGSMVLRATSPKGLISKIPVYVNAREASVVTAASANVSVNGSGVITATISDAAFGAPAVGVCVANVDLNVSNASGVQLPVSGASVLFNSAVSYLQTNASPPPATVTAAAGTSLSIVSAGGLPVHRIAISGVSCAATPTATASGSVEVATPTPNGRLATNKVWVIRTP